MLEPILKKVFGTKNDRELKKIKPIIDSINQMEKQISPLSDDALKAKTQEFKGRVEKGESLDDLLPEAFAVAREAAIRVIGQRHYDVQLLGGVVLHNGQIAEMRTGEGKTLTSVLPTYLNALTGKGVHIVTVNDYLAKRDAEWMGQIHRFLGLDVGYIVHGIMDADRKKAYQKDVVYGQNNEFGFDYLRDNMKFRLEDYVQREHQFAIVDEVDSILIDEARTPLIISGPSESSTDVYYKVNSVIPKLEKEKHYTTEEKTKSASLTDEGVSRVEEILKIDNLFDPRNMETLHAVNQALRAHSLYRNDKEYVVREGQVIIVDEFTGRLMPGRRWSDGLHQAIEAKEGVKIESENQTLATITFQNYFRMYDKLSGMTGTADTEAGEFKSIYNLDVVVVPTNKPLIRDDMADSVYKNENAKFKAIVDDIKDCQERGQPALVGTVSIEKSEAISQALKAKGVQHKVLNAKQHEKEADYVAQAGRKGAITIATNMAGRGTDIVLGGNPEFMAREEARKQGIDPDDEFAFTPLLKGFEESCNKEKKEVLEAGGLHIVGTERHESRRIDNQLRGRAGRQGDPGSSRFYLSLEDDLMRIFGGQRIQKIMDRMGMEDDEPIEHNMVSKAIENAQKKVEGHNFDIRKHLLQYDDVMNQQRNVIYKLRRQILEGGENTRELSLAMIEELSENLAVQFAPQKTPASEWDWSAINEAFFNTFRIQGVKFDANSVDKSEPEALMNAFIKEAEKAFHAKEKEYGKEVVRDLERILYLQIIDQQWKDHLLQMDHLKEGIGLRGYGQKDPLLEYKKEAFELFNNMKIQVKAACTAKFFEVRLMSEEELEAQQRAYEREAMERLRYADNSAPSELSAGGGVLRNTPRPAVQSQMEKMRQKHEEQAAESLNQAFSGASRSNGSSTQGTVVRQAPKVGRNDPCPCGSGKKYKKCHGS